MCSSDCPSDRIIQQDGDAVSGPDSDGDSTQVGNQCIHTFQLFSGNSGIINAGHFDGMGLVRLNDMTGKNSVTASSKGLGTVPNIIYQKVVLHIGQLCCKDNIEGPHQPQKAGINYRRKTPIIV